MCEGVGSRGVGAQGPDGGLWPAAGEGGVADGVTDTVAVRGRGRDRACERERAAAVAVAAGFESMLGANCGAEVPAT